MAAKFVYNFSSQKSHGEEEAGAERGERKEEKRPLATSL
jgi:hypothetical protein